MSLEDDGRIEAFLAREVGNVPLPDEDETRDELDDGSLTQLFELMLDMREAIIEDEAQATPEMFPVEWEENA